MQIAVVIRSTSWRLLNGKPPAASLAVAWPFSRHCELERVWPAKCTFDGRIAPPNTNRDSPLTLAYNVIAMLRKTLTILSLIGLLLSVGLWVASAFGWGIRCAHTGYYFSWRNAYLSISDGYLAAIWDRYNRFETMVGTLHIPYVACSDSDHTNMGWLVNNFAEPYWSGYYPCLRLPLWSLPVAFSVIPACSVGGPWLRRRSRSTHGLCVKCGYDLRGSKDKCPECGQAFEERILVPAS